MDIADGKMQESTALRVVQVVFASNLWNGIAFFEIRSVTPTCFHAGPSKLQLGAVDRP
jgi:hypothetical protein